MKHVEFSVGYKMNVYVCRSVIPTGLPLFLRVFAKQRKRLLALSYLSVSPSVCPFVWLSIGPPVRLSVCLFFLGFHSTSFHEIWYLSIFRRSAKEIQFSLKSDKKSSTLREDRCIFMIISRWILLRMRNIADRFEENLKHTFCVP